MNHGQRFSSPILIGLFLLSVLSSLPAWAEGFSSQVYGISAEAFPIIKLGVKVYSPEPIAPTCDSFDLFEKQTRITSFTVTMPKQKHYVVLLLDRSSSIEPAMPLVKESAAAFAKAVAGKAELAVHSLGSDFEINQDFTTNTDDLLKAIRAVRPWGGTLLIDSLYKSCDALRNQAGTNDLKTIVCLTDGRDETPGGKSPFSSKKPEELIEFARRSHVRLITVGLGNGIDTNLLQSCANQTNGWYLHVPKPEQLAKAYQELSRKMMMERLYHFTYTTPEPKPDGTRRDLAVNSKAKGEKDQGKGWYIAPTVEQLKNKQEQMTGTSGTSTGKATGMKLNPPDLGKPGSVGRLDHVPLGNTGRIDRLGSHSVGSLGQIGSLGPGLEHVERDVNQMFKQLDQQNQQHLDNGINQGNQAIDAANESNAAIDAANQQQTDQIIDGTNTTLEQIDQNNLSDHQKAQDAVNQTYDQMNQQLQDAMPDMPGMPDMPDMPDTSGDD